MTRQSDRVFVSEIECASAIGVTDEERAAPQRLSIDVEVMTDLRAAAVSDDVADSVDYGQIVRMVADMAGDREYRLLETLAERIADGVLTELGGDSVRVLVRKLTAPIPTPLKFVSVEVVRQSKNRA